MPSLSMLRSFTLLWLLPYTFAMSLPQTPAELAAYLIWPIHQPAAAETRFRDALKGYPAGSAQQAQVQTQLARALGLQGKFAEAHTLLDELEPKLANWPPEVEVRYRLERGRLLNSSKQPEKALPLFIQAWNQGRAAKLDYLAVDAAHMAGIAAPIAQQLDWNRQALDYALQSREPAVDRWKRILTHNIGMTYLDQGKYTDALTAFEQSQSLNEAQGDPRGIHIARWCVAHALRLLGQSDKALAMQRALESQQEATGERDGYVFEELAELLEARGETAAAKPYWQKAHVELSKEAWLVRDKPERLARMKRLAGG